MSNNDPKIFLSPPHTHETDSVQQASYLKGGPLLWILALYLHVNKKSDDDDTLFNLIVAMYVIEN